MPKQKFRARFNLGLGIRVKRDIMFIVELMRVGDILEFEQEGEEIVEVIENSKLITSSRDEGGRSWYANHYAFEGSIIKLDEPVRKRFRSYRAVSNYCEKQKQRRDN